MGRTSYSCNFYSHKNPKICLCEHLKSVEQLCELFTNGVVLFDNFSICGETVDKQKIVGSAKLIALSHDLGKATEFFQDYLLKDGRSSFRNRHSLISAVIGFKAAQKIFGNESVISYLVYTVIKNHHSDLGDFLDNFVLDEQDTVILKEQWESIDKDKFKNLLLKIRYPLDFLAIESLFKDNLILNEIRRSKIKVRRLLGKNNNQKLYFLFTLLFSILIDADKSNTAAKGLSVHHMFNRQDIPSDIVEQYLKDYIEPNAGKSKINKLRKETYKYVINKVNDEKHFYVLDAPTGMGKTLSVLSFAVKLRNRVYKKHGYLPRIIYAMPFLSIIDQNAEVVSDIFEKILKRRPYSNEVLVHHHLSEILFETKEFENLETNLSKNLIESWNSEIVITTFIQLFYSLFTNRNKMLKKFHRILNSIIILDEVQAIPPVYYKLIRKTFAYMSETFGLYVILSTATQPLILQNCAVRMPEKSEVNYSLIDRFVIETNNNKIAFDDFVEKLAEDLKKNSDKSFLVIVNTISYAEKIFDAISKSKIYGDLVYLSSFVTPSERKERIDKIKDENDKRKIVISTQVVEAGVDIDLDIVYRDLAPFDSIVQSAGRCNRNGLTKCGRVNVFEIIDERGRALWSYIYNLYALERTKKLLENRRIDEIVSRQLSVYYSDDISSIISQKKSNDILEAIEKLRYHIVADFRLIEEDLERFPVFIETDEALKKGVWRKYEQIAQIEDKFKRRDEFLKIRKEFYDYIVSIPAKILQVNAPPLVYGFYFVKNNQLDEFYNRNTGFIRNGQNAIW